MCVYTYRETMWQSSDRYYSCDCMCKQNADEHDVADVEMTIV